MPVHSGLINLKSPLNEAANLEEQLEYAEPICGQVLDFLNERGFNSIVIFQTYDPFTKQSGYSFVYSGDIYAIKGALSEINNEL